MTRPFVLGIDCSMYRQPDTRRLGPLLDGQNAAPPTNPFTSSGRSPAWSMADWVELETVRDVTLNLTGSTADVTSRKSNGWRQNVSVLKEGSVDFSLLWQPDDPTFVEVMNQYMNHCAAAFLILDGPLQWWLDGVTEAGRCSSTGVVTGLYADFVVTSFTRNETLEEGLTADVTLEPSMGLIYPEWLTLAVDGQP